MYRDKEESESIIFGSVRLLEIGEAFNNYYY